jgi:hypothetical protein
MVSLVVDFPAHWRISLRVRDSVIAVGDGGGGAAIVHTAGFDDIANALETIDKYQIPTDLFGCRELCCVTVTASAYGPRAASRRVGDRTIALVNP